MSVIHLLRVLITTERTKILSQAGELLGRIHKLSSRDNVFKLEKYDVFDFYNHEVDDHIKVKLKIFVDSYSQILIPKFLRKSVYQAVYNQEYLKNSSLIWIETPHDYKANNLIYKDTPVLIDPDNAKWIPRMFDLALALLLFHNELFYQPPIGFLLLRNGNFL